MVRIIIVSRIKRAGMNTIAFALALIGQIRSGSAAAVAVNSFRVLVYQVNRIGGLLTGAVELMPPFSNLGAIRHRWQVLGRIARVHWWGIPDIGIVIDGIDLIAVARRIPPYCRSITTAGTR